MAVIKKKILKVYFDQVASGKKKYELRLGDFEVQEGDILVLEEWDKESESYTGRTIEKKVTHVGTFKLEDIYAFWKKERIEEHGLQIISIE